MSTTPIQTVFDKLVEIIDEISGLKVYYGKLELSNVGVRLPAAVINQITGTGRHSGIGQQLANNKTGEEIILRFQIDCYAYDQNTVDDYADQIVHKIFLSENDFRGVGCTRQDFMGASDLDPDKERSENLARKMLDYRFWTEYHTS